MKYWPYIYEPDKSIEVYGQTEKYLQDNIELKERVQYLGWIYHDIGDIIPQTAENIWSGHYFPFTESWEELQVSFNLICLGLYKQAFASLRSGLELGLLSVYYNINDDGHNIVKEWLQSNEDRSADTPTSKKIWGSLKKNKNISVFNEKFNIEKFHQDLGYLHNYVHTKGIMYSNSMGSIKGNSQAFLPSVITRWLKSFEDVICLVATLHLLKYPISVIRYDYQSKFGIDIPSFGNLEEQSIDRIAKILPKGYLKEIENISANDIEVKEFLEYLNSLPDMTENEAEQQAITIEKILIENGEGFTRWLKRQEDTYKSLGFDDFSIIMENRVSILKEWAEENGFLLSKDERMGL